MNTKADRFYVRRLSSDGTFFDGNYYSGFELFPVQLESDEKALIMEMVQSGRPYLLLRGEDGFLFTGVSNNE